jgi:ketol-acid reductoisomerase
LTRGPRIINTEVRKEMRRVLDEIQDGTFATEWIAENRNGRKRYQELRQAGMDHQVEKVGAELRKMMPFVTAGHERFEDVSGGAIS